MGFTVDSEKNIVNVDHTHNYFCKTSPDGNPTSKYLETNFKVSSIFARTKHKSSEKTKGDNCPMLYALKGLSSLKTTRKDIILLRDSYSIILNSYLDDGFIWDYILPLPSSSKLSSSFGRRVQKSSNRGALREDFLVKTTAGNVLKNLDEMSIKSSDKAKIKQDVKRFITNNGRETSFQIKCIKSKLRRHINPFEWQGVDGEIPRNSKILLVDDMITSGSSLLSAFKIIKEYYPDSQIEALTLFGSMN